MILCVWRPGTGDQTWDAGMTRATLKLRDASNFAKGFILKDLAKMKVGDGDTAQFAAIWRSGSGEQRWKTGLDHDEFKDADADFFDKSLRLKVLDIEGESFTGVWRPGTGEQRWRSRLDDDEFKKQDAEFFGKGLRLVQIVRDYGDFAGVWTPGSGEQRWRAGMDLDEFKSQDDEFVARGLRLVDVAIIGGFSASLTAVWRPGTGEQRWASRETDNKDELVEIDKEFVAKGLRMEIIAVHR
jgi:hypothetical protein